MGQHNHFLKTFLNLFDIFWSYSWHIYKHIWHILTYSDPLAISWQSQEPSTVQDLSLSRSGLHDSPRACLGVTTLPATTSSPGYWNFTWHGHARRKSYTCRILTGESAGRSWKCKELVTWRVHPRSRKFKKPKSMNQRRMNQRLSDWRNQGMFTPLPYRGFHYDFTMNQRGSIWSIHFNPINPLQDQTEQHLCILRGPQADSKLYQMVQQQQMYPCPCLSDKFHLLFEVTSGSLAAAFQRRFFGWFITCQTLGCTTKLSKFCVMLW